MLEIALLWCHWKLTKHQYHVVAVLQDRTSNAILKCYVKVLLQSSHSCFSGGIRTWKILSFLVALPGVGLCFINAQLKEAEHHEHYERPEFVAYEHLRMRTKVSTDWQWAIILESHFFFYQIICQFYQDFLWHETMDLFFKTYWNILTQAPYSWSLDIPN